MSAARKVEMARDMARILRVTSQELDQLLDRDLDDEIKMEEAYRICEDLGRAIENLGAAESA